MILGVTFLVLKFLHFFSFFFHYDSSVHLSIYLIS